MEKFIKKQPKKDVRKRVRYSRIAFTSFNPDDFCINYSYCSYYIYQREKCPETGRIHIQGYAEFDRQLDLNVVKSSVFDDNTIHIERARGNAQQNIQYCSKSSSRVGEPVTFGTPKKQGERTDLREFASQVGKVSDREMMEKFPAYMLRYSKGYTFLKSIELKTQSMIDRKVTSFCYWGTAGAGKTRKVYDLYGYENVYCYEPIGNGVWFDGYDGEDVLLFDDFYGNLPFAFLLRVLDRYPLRLPIKGSFTWAQWSIVVFTSNVHPDKWYKHLEKTQDMDDAFHRRLPDSNIVFM